MVMAPCCCVRHIVLVVLIGDEGIHEGYGSRLVIEGAVVHGLDAEPLVDGQQFGRRRVELLLPRCFSLAQVNSSDVTNSGRRMVDIHWKAVLSA